VSLHGVEIHLQLNCFCLPCHAGQLNTAGNAGKCCAVFPRRHHAAPAMTLGSCCRMRSPKAVRTPGCPLHTSLARCGYSRLQHQEISLSQWQHPCRISIHLDHKIAEARTASITRAT
jgi:hypothetical protein